MKHWVVAAVLLASCGNSDAPPNGSTRLRFEDVTASSGVDFVLTSGHLPTSQILEAKGGGLALIDYDRDGDEDVFVPNGAFLDSPDSGPGARLFENLGEMRFRDTTEVAHLDFRRWGQGVAVGDVDGDGFDDIYVACFGRDALLRNHDGKTFVETTDSTGLGDTRWSTAAAFGDLDGDGDLDLYVVNYLKFDPRRPPSPEQFYGTDVFAGPLLQEPEPDALYENLGDGRFRDISESSGIRSVQPGPGLGCVILDFDGDGRQDIFVGNDSTPNHLLRNLGGLRFEEVGVAVGLGVSGDGAGQATMGIAIADVNADRRPDVFTSNFSGDTNTLHVSVPGSFLYEDRTRQYRLGAVSSPFLGWASWFADFDLDGDEDLISFNGHVYPQATPETMNSSFLQTPLLFERRGAAFERVENAGAWLTEPHCDRSATFGDLDLDGDVDVIVGELNGRLRFLRNDRRAGHYLVVSLNDPRPGIHNTHGLGSTITLDAGGQLQTRWIFSGGSYQAACSPRAFFGLEQTEPVSLEVRWPDGTTQRLEQVAVDQLLTVERH